MRNPAAADQSSHLCVALGLPSLSEKTAHPPQHFSTRPRGSANTIDIVGVARYVRGNPVSVHALTQSRALASLRTHDGPASGHPRLGRLGSPHAGFRCAPRARPRRRPARDRPPPRRQPARPLAVCTWPTRRPRALRATGYDIEAAVGSCAESHWAFYGECRPDAFGDT